MRKILCTVCLLLLINAGGCRDVINDRRVEKLHTEIVSLHKRNFELQKIIESQRIEIVRLKSQD